MAQELYLRYRPNFEIKVSALRMGVCYRERFASLLEQSKQSTNFLTKKPTGKIKKHTLQCLNSSPFPLISKFTVSQHIHMG